VHAKAKKKKKKKKKSTDSFLGGVGRRV